jgi:hypothetical protein
MYCASTLSTVVSLQGSVKRRRGVDFLIDFRQDRVGISFYCFETHATSEACNNPI